MVYQSGRPEHGFVLPQLVVRVNSPHQIVTGHNRDDDDDVENDDIVGAILKILLVLLIIEGVMIMLACYISAPNVFHFPLDQ